MNKVVRKKDFTGGAEVKTPCSRVEGAGLIPGQGTKISHADGVATKKKKRKKSCYLIEKMLLINAPKKVVWNWDT